MIPLLGIAVVVGALMAVTYYVSLQRRIQASQTLTMTLDHLQRDHRLSLALKRIHDGNVGEAAQQLDVMLCDDILQLNSDLASADERTRAFATYAFCRIGHTRPSAPAVSSDGAALGLTDDQIAAQRILAMTMTGEIATR
jgi:hypothetical protein